MPTNLEKTFLSNSYDIDFKHDLQLNVNDDTKYNMDNGNSIHNKNVNFNDEYYKVHNIAASVRNNEFMAYHTYNDTVRDTALYDSVNTNTSCHNDNDCLYQL